MTELKKENELTTIEITNPTSEDFTQRFNGEPFTLKAGELTIWAKKVALHVAKHLSDKIISDENPPKLKKNPTEREINREENRVSQLKSFDNPTRRIALYRILKDTMKVQDVILDYNFGGFIGEMDIYKQFVLKSGDKFKERDLGAKRLTEIEKVEKLTNEVNELKEMLSKVLKSKKDTKPNTEK